MSTVFFILACFSGLWVFAFGIAAHGELIEQVPPPESPREGFVRLLDIVFLGGWFLNAHIRAAWSKRPRARRLVYLALGWLGALILFVALCIFSSIYDW